MRTLTDFGLNGKEALIHCLKSTAYGSLEQAVASLTLFTHPDTVRQTQGKNLFRIIRQKAVSERGTLSGEGAARVMRDDNTGPTDAFLWSNGIRRGQFLDVTFNHLNARSSDVEHYTSLANLCMTPTFLAKLTDTDSSVKAHLRFRAYALYACGSPPEMPAGYDALAWASPLPYQGDLENNLRAAMATKGKSRTVCSARELGWLFSGFLPDARL
jgi:hypothetical protein